MNKTLLYDIASPVNKKLVWGKKGTEVTILADYGHYVLVDNKGEKFHVSKEKIK